VEQGGPREFDGAQIKYIVDAISSDFSFPSESDVASCRSRYPQFSRSYAAYSDLVSVIDKDLQSLRDLAAKLEASH
jgi:hypothetical protein